MYGYDLAFCAEGMISWQATGTFLQDILAGIAFPHMKGAFAQVNILNCGMMMNVDIVIPLQVFLTTILMILWPVLPVWPIHALDAWGRSRYRFGGQ